jgi:hypothetical protein
VLPEQHAAELGQSFGRIVFGRIVEARVISLTILHRIATRERVRA